MIPAILSLLLATAALAASTPGCDDSTYAEVDEGLLAVTPDAAPTDSCAWETLHVQNEESDTVSDASSARASFSMAQAPGSPIKSVARHQAKGNGWSSRFELQGDGLTRRQIGWNETDRNGKGWRVVAGDQNDTAMPLWPQWLPRRSLPDGWSAASESQPFLPKTSIPQGLGAGVFSEEWKAYALTAMDPLQGSGAPPWEKPWELHQITAGASAALPWIASLQISETRITSDDVDSVADQLIAMGIATPHQLLALNGAWSSSRQNPQGGFALGTTWTQRLSSSRFQITLRQRSRQWTSAWDPTYSADADPSASSGTAEAGAGEGNASLRVPFRMDEWKGSTTSEAWAAWNPEVSTHKFGARSTIEWHRRDMRFELRGLHREWTYASGTTGFHNFMSIETGLGRAPEWRAGAYRIWEKTSWREGLSLAADTRWHEWSVRPGAQIESVKDEEVLTSASLSMRWKIDKSWRLETESSAPCNSDFRNELRWRATLRYIK